MTIIWADVTAFAPELTDLDLAAQVDILNHVNTALVPTEWRTADRLRLAQIYLAAHIGTLAQQGTIGPVTSETVGSISRSFANVFSGNQLISSASGLNRTSYGQLYKLLLSTSAARAPLVL